MARERTLSEQAFEQFPQALILVDRETTVLSLNAVGERLTGWAMRDAVGRPAADIHEGRTETGVNLCAPNGALRRAPPVCPPLQNPLPHLLPPPNHRGPGPRSLFGAALPTNRHAAA